jgi:hypothetical protein
VPTRTPEEIRASIEQNRLELGSSLEKLRGEVEQLTDWRSQLGAHQQQLTIGAGAAGFVLGGGVAAFGSLVFGRKARKQRRRAARAAAS